ncbi:MAG: DUF2760 domain-containing protein [Magnetococcales bacterium]|nr:DUF2760 domain-containing protein [Magnetococcales bacterium]
MFAVFTQVILLVAYIDPEAIVPFDFIELVQQNREQFPWAVLAISLLLLPAIFVIRIQSGPKKIKPRAEAVRPEAELPGSQRCEAEIVAFLGVLQEKGRLIDFLMEEIVSYEDAQVGAAARVIHEGCRSALKEHFDIIPVRDEAEGSKVIVPAGFSPDSFQLLGKITGEAPFTGTLVHKGWRTQKVKLPRTLKDSGGGRLPAIAPAQVELK